MWKRMAMGAAAGAVGTATLNIFTYLDMTVTGRGASGMPAQVAGMLADKAGVGLGEEHTAENRQTGLGALLGYVTGIGMGIVYGALYPTVRSLPPPIAGLLLGAGAMAGTDVPMTALGVTDPREWGVRGWAADIVPHLAYGLAAAATYERLSD